MKVKDFDSLFIHELKDLYGAEKQLVKMLPKMAKKANNEDLREAFEAHIEETRQQIQRLEEVFQELEISSRGAKCAGMEGIIEEAKELLEEDMEGDVLDVALICAAQRAEHYEIASYGCVRSLAQQIGRHDLAEELQKTLDQEHKTDRLLNELALGHINEEAAQDSQLADESMEHEGNGRHRRQMQEEEEMEEQNA